MTTHKPTKPAPTGAPITAVRTWNRPHTAAIITVRHEDDAFTAGGARAERAQAAILAQYERQPVKLYGLRADLHAAEVEAERMMTATHKRQRGGPAIEIRTALWAIAVPVVEDGATPKAPAARTAPAVDVVAAATKAVRRKMTDRRNETSHPDGAAAVAHAGCPTCKARKAAKCIRHDGNRTNHVHAARMARYDAAVGA